MIPTIRFKLSVALLVPLGIGACSDPWPEMPPIDAAIFATEHADWREYRQGRLVEPPGGAVIWIGLWDLPDGASVTFGSDPAHPIVLPEEDAGPFAGTLVRSGEAVTLIPEAGSGISVYEGEDVQGPLELRHDRMDDPTRLVLGSLGLRVHSEQGTDRLWLRAWDEDSPLIETFRLPDFYPVDPSWNLVARFEPYEEAKTITVPDVTGGMVEYNAPGDIVFRKDGQEHRLIATRGATSTSYFIMMWDSTATKDTYQGGRYVRAEFEDSLGWTTIDFNRTYNAPCVFTPYSVCALPPRENWLPLAVSAGEKRPDKLPVGR